MSQLLSAQNNDKEQHLDEVVIKASRVVNKNDGFMVYPSNEQKKASHNGYSVLQKLSLPNIRVINNSVSVIDNRGNVQIRINGILADDADMKSLDPKLILRIRFIDSPGVRYGDDISYVIDIQTVRDDKGYALGVDMSQDVNRKNGSYMSFGKWNNANSELSLSYNFGYMDNDKMGSTEIADYHLTDGTIYNITRKDIDKRSRSFDNNIKLKYNYSDSLNNVFQVSISSAFNNTPGNNVKTDVWDGDMKYIVNTHKKNKVISPVLDFYYSHDITPRQNFTINAVGTYISTDAFESNDERSLYQYTTKGRSYSLLSEMIYENRLKPFTLSLGLNYKQKYTDNQYLGDVDTYNNIHNNRLHLFSDIKGSISKLNYSAGLRATYIDYRQYKHKYNEWLFCPKASLTYSFTRNLQLRYDFEILDRASRIAMTGDAVIRENSMEWVVGSPDLKTNRDITNILRLSYNTKRLQTFAEMYYKICSHPNMAHYERTEDNKFIYTQRNQDRIEVINAMLYLNYWLIPDKVSASATGGLFRCFNFGDDYTHCYTSYFASASINAYLGNFMLSAYTYNANRFLEGETKGYNAGNINLQASYTNKNWFLALTWNNPFLGNQRLFESELLNKNLYKIKTLRSSFATDVISLNISYKFSNGRRYRDIKKAINLRDTDSGILR